MTTIKCIIDGAHGIYVPQAFVKRFENWQGIDAEDLAILLEGPDNRYYWDSWDYVLATASYKDDDGHTWTLYQDGDLFAVRDDHEFED